MANPGAGRPASTFASRLSPARARPPQRRRLLAVAAATVAAALLLAGVLILQPSEGSRTKTVAAYLTDFPGDCDEFKVIIAAVTALEERSPLRVTQSEVVISRHRGLAEGIKIAEGEVRADGAGPIDIAVPEAACLRGDEWVPVRVPPEKAVISVRNAISSSPMGTAAVVDFLLDSSIRTVQGPGATSSELELVPVVEVHQIIVDTHTFRFPENLGEILELLRDKITKLEDQVSQLLPLTQELALHLCSLPADRIPTFCADLGQLPTGGPITTVPGTTGATLPPVATTCPVGQIASLVGASLSCSSPASDPCAASAAACATSDPPPPPPPPGAARTPVPASGSTPILAPIQLAWSAPLDPGTYSYYVELDGSSVSSCAAIAALTCAISAPSPGEHKWNVAVVNSAGHMTSGQEWKFVVNTPPSAATLTNAPNHLLRAPPIIVTWAPGVDPDGQALEHQVLYGTTNPPTEVKCGWSTTATSCSLGSTRGVLYHWRVQTREVGTGGQTFPAVDSAVHEAKGNRLPNIPSNPSRDSSAGTGYPGTFPLSFSGGDPDPGQAMEYTIHYLVDLPGDSWSWSDVKICGTARQASLSCNAEVLPNTSYDWWVHAYDGSEWSYGPWWEFATSVPY